MESVSDALRRAIRTCGMTQAELSRRSDVPESGISRFMAHTSELRTGNVDKIAAVLGLTLEGKRGKARKGR